GMPIFGILFSLSLWFPDPQAEREHLKNNETTIKNHYKPYYLHTSKVFVQNTINRYHIFVKNVPIKIVISNRI
ncbi:MAG: hypothetical protein J1E40_05965, partial [Oscillospiraceae bacterium]|nr:hypothetical protein [Oscillospiraceae bacterium]